MKTIEEFFDEVEAYKGKLDGHSSKTIHTSGYKETVKEFYADWQQVKISLKPFISPNVISSIDEGFTSLLRESRRANSRVNESANILTSIEEDYIEYIYPEVSHREIESGFVNSLIADLEQVQKGKYHEYMEEAIQCIQADAYRGAVVLGWQAAMYGLYQEMKKHDEPFHVVYQKKFGAVPGFEVNSFWDFQKLQDQNILILAEDIGLIDKSIKDMLNREKDTRNKAAHPGIYDVGPNGTKAHLEIVMQLLIELEL